MIRKPIQAIRIANADRHADKETGRQAELLTDRERETAGNEQTPQSGIFLSVSSFLPQVISPYGEGETEREAHGYTTP